ncbi:ABC transporter family protein [Tritrichomonas foetus]|uniref:ABC transporter family protein n=1 Tax=Tritrichomonas foetus TaxID=1144522 RepID=A0A1J4J5E8_9EUKA|nr:ABC transporter family protein [Tritrichomonas foetus]|eukprot:OHS94474.1 ABC transporter family protein [Tritrichomonas foetus]
MSDSDIESMYLDESDYVPPPNNKEEFTKEEKKEARSHLYSVLFHECSAKIAVFPSLIIGAIPIVVYLVFGQILNLLADRTKNTEEKYKDLQNFGLYYIIIAVGAGFCKFLDTFLWIRLGSKLSVKIRKQLFNTMMKSEVTFFDVNPIGGILTLLSEDAQMVQDAFGTMKGEQLQYIAQFLSGIILSFVYSWRLALIALATVPVVLIFIGIFVPKVVKLSAQKFENVSKSMTIAEESLSSIRTVKTFNRESIEIKRFIEYTENSGNIEIKISLIMTAMMSLIMIVIWSMVVGNVYYGGTLVVKGVMPVGDLFSVFGFTMLGSFAILSMQGSMQSEQKAIAAGARILKLSRHQSEVQFEGGKKIENFKGHIEFKNVSFKYPTRDTYVLRNVSFDVPAGQIAAFVGHSGSGKSTVVQLLERFYDVTEGAIYLDDVDIRELDPRWLHHKIALVAQEPTLFQCSIEDNIKYGAKKATKEQVIAAAEAANARKFIEKLPHGYKEIVGEKGSSLSGGQRQRIAIARAVIKDPVILITDEATSALDAGSEKKVQNALDKVMADRTAVVVAHRLSTVRNADVIYVFDAGEIKEQGTHDELLTKGGYYYNLVQRQLTEEDHHLLKKN